jgi:hypothetical protein
MVDGPSAAPAGPSSGLVIWREAETIIEPIEALVAV